MIKVVHHHTLCSFSGLHLVEREVEVVLGAYGVVQLGAQRVQDQITLVHQQRARLEPAAEVCA